MKTYKVKTVAGQILTFEARRIEFGPGHVSFWVDTHLVKALRTPFVTEVTEEPAP